jgi:hypothetical protein
MGRTPLRVEQRQMASCPSGRGNGGGHTARPASPAPWASARALDDCRP